MARSRRSTTCTATSPALEAVLAEVPDDATIVVGGDVARAAPPSETLDAAAWARRPRHLAARQRRPRAHPGRGRACAAGRARRGARAALSEEQIAFLHGLPPTTQVVGACSTATRRRATTSTSSPSARPRSGSRSSSSRSTADASCAATRTCSSTATIAGKRVVNAGSVGMPYEDEPGAYWLLDLEHRRTPYELDVGDWPSSGRRSRGGPRVLHRAVDSDLVPVGRVGRPHGLDGSFFVEGPSDRADAFANGATLYADGEPAKIVVLEARLAGPAGDQARPPGRARRDARRAARGAAAARARTSSTPSSSSASRSRRRAVGSLGRVREVLDYPANDVLELDSGLLPPARRGLCAAGGHRGRANRYRAQALQTPNENRRLHPRPHAFAWLTEQRPIAGVLGTRARAAAVQLPRHDAAARRPGRRRAVRRRRRDGPPGRRGRGRARGRLRRRAAAAA